MERTIKEKREIYLAYINKNLERLQDSYDDDSPEWEIINKINELMEELED